MTKPKTTGIHFNTSTTVNTHLRNSLGLRNTPYVARVRQENEATAPGLNMFSRPVYDPARDLTSRIGLARA